MTELSISRLKLPARGRSGAESLCGALVPQLSRGDRKKMKTGAPLAQHEEALVRAFVRPDRRARLLELLGTSKGRAKLRAALAHFADLDPRFARPLLPSKHHAHDIGTILRERGAPETCYILSESPDLDGREMPLNSALDRIVGGGMGSFISCIAGKLGYFESEETGERYILERTI